MGVELQCLLVVVGDADGRLEGLLEGDAGRGWFNGPLAAVNDRIGRCKLVGLVVNFAQHAYADFDERAAGLGGVVADGAFAVAGAKLFDRPRDGVV